MGRFSMLLDLGTLPGDQGGDAVAINQLGQVAGNSLKSWDYDATVHPFLWEEGVMRPLNPQFPNGPWWERVFAMNRFAAVAGARMVRTSLPGFFVEHAVVWDQGSVWDLGTLGADEWSHSEGLAINDRGDVVGWSHQSGDQHTRHPVLWRRTDAAFLAAARSR